MNNIKKLKKQIMEIVSHKDYVPMKIKELKFLMQMLEGTRYELDEAIEELIKEDRVMMSKKGRIRKVTEEFIKGRFEVSIKGFGYVFIEDESVADYTERIFIPEKSINGAMHKDMVSIRVYSYEGENGEIQKYGEIAYVLERGYTEIVGTFQKNKNFGFVIPDNVRINTDIYVPQGRDKGAVTGHKVVVHIKDYGNQKRKPEGIIREIIGHINNPEVDVLSIIKAFDLPLEFSKEVLKYVKDIPSEVLEEDKIGRYNITNWQTVTIDGEDAKDLDDAITITKDNDIFTLGVHIADVTHYVKENSVLDKEALNRGTSVYLVDRVIPMLPPQLSNGICSLNEGVDRLALSCIMKINSKGELIGHDIEETIIKVDQRMSYTSVKKILENEDAEEINQYEEFIPMFKNMEELSGILRKRREKRGAIDFDFPETKIILDNKGNPIEIRPYERNIATKIIEDFMLAANETIAEDYFWNELPFIYRTHQIPDEEKIQKLCTFIYNFGYNLKITDKIHPKELQKLLKQVQGKEEEPLISRVTLRSLKQARYTTSCDGHFGLSAKYYCHFTSPIRRYPDLQIHRIIKEDLNRKLSEKRKQHYDAILDKVAIQSSTTERRGEEAEREVSKLKKVVYMSKRIGNMYKGAISGITNWGCYVELDNSVEGLVHITTLADDYYIYDEGNYRLIGEKSHKVYEIGMKVIIEVIKTDKMLRTIDFVLRTEEDYMEWQQVENFTSNL